MKKKIYGIIGVVISCAGLWTVNYAVRLWGSHAGMLDGICAAAVYWFGLVLATRGCKVQWNAIVKEWQDAGWVLRVMNVPISILYVWIGYKVLIIGWTYWWTDFSASLGLGLAGLIVGCYMIVISLIVVSAGLFPSYD